MADDPSSQRLGMDRRKFLLLAGAGAALGALILAAKPRNLFQGLSGTTQTQVSSQSAPGRRIGTPVQQTGTSFLSRLLGRNP